MQASTTKRGVPAAIAAVAMLVLLAACGTRAPVQRTASYLDGKTGATITRVEEPGILFSEDPARAANARDYLYAAPLEVNQSGRRSWWLWLGLWSSIDRGAAAGDAARPEIEELELIVDGEPMELDLATRSESIPGAGHVPYAAPVPGARTILLPLTGSQVTRLSHGRDIRIHTEMTTGASLLWQPWTGAATWTSFAELLAASPAASP